MEESDKSIEQMVDKFAKEIQQKQSENSNIANEAEFEIYRNIATEPVESSNIESIGYLKESRILKVIFKGGSSYIYKNVDELHIKNINNAKSIGRYFNDNIKAFPEKYECIKL